MKLTDKDVQDFTESGKEYTQCPTRGVPYMVGDSHAEKTRKIIKTRCKQWDCPYCAPINKSIHYNRIANGIVQLSKRGYVFTFCTITCHEKWRGYKASLKNWRANKDKLLARYRRAYAKSNANKPEYVYIPEIHEDGTIHIHGLFSGNIQTRWWKDAARGCGLGYMAESEELKSVLQAVNYCTKYIQKQMGVANISKGFRRINYSRGFPASPVHKSGLAWRMLESDETIRDAIREGLVGKNLDVWFDDKQWYLDDIH